MIIPEIEKFDSYAEKEAWKIIKPIAVKLEFDVVYQKKVYGEGQTDYIYPKKKKCSYYDEGFYHEENYEEDYYENSEFVYGNGPYYYDFVKYIIDFELIKNNLKIAIEIDSKKWHKDQALDERKDKYLEHCGYNILRIMASDVFGNKKYVIRYIDNSLENLLQSKLSEFL